MKKTKENVYVVIDTPKKAKKVKKVLDMFGEPVYAGTYERLANGLVSSEYPLIHFNYEFTGYAKCLVQDKTEVSIKELGNILAVEHLKEGDVVVVKNEYGKWIIKLTGNNIGRFEHSSSYDLCKGFLNDPESVLHSNKIYGGSLLRYATEEEKALLEDKPKSIEVGKWYKGIGDKLIFTTSEEQGGYVKAYGFGAMDGWFEDDHDFTWTTDDLKEATKEEVEQALIKEAKKRGYADGVKVKCLGHKIECTIDKSENEVIYHSEWNKLWFGLHSDRASFAVVVFQEGKWAEIVEPSFVESADKIKVSGENIGKRVRVIDGGHGAKGCDGKVGVIVDRSSVDFSSYGGACSTDRAECYIMTDEGYYWGLCEGYEIEYLTESSPLTVSLEIKDIATLQVIQKTLKELEEKLTKLI